MSAQQKPSQRSGEFSIEIVGAGLWQLSTVTVQGVLQLVVMGILSRLLVPADFGLAAVASVLTGFGAMLSDMGIAAAVIQRNKLSDGETKTGFVMTVALGVCLAALMYLFSGFVERAVAIKGSAIVVSFTALGFMVSSLGSVSRALLQRNLLFRKLFVVDVGSYIVSYLVVGLPMAMAGYGVWSLVGAYVVQSLTQSLLVLKFRPIPWGSRMSAQAMKSLLPFGAGLTVTRILNYAAIGGDQLVVGRMLGSTALGTYERVMRILALPGLYLGNVLDTVLFPAMSKIQDDPPKIAEAFYSSMSIVWILLVPLSAFLFFLAGEIVSILLGPGWEAAVDPLRILFLVLPFRTSTQIMDSLVRAKGAVYRSAFRRFLFLVAVVAGVVLGSNYGLVGVSVGVALATVFLFAMMLSLAFPIASLRPVQFLRAIAPGTILGVVVVVVAGTFTSLRSLMPLGSVALSVSCLILCGLAVALTLKLFPRLAGEHIHRLYAIVSTRWNFARPTR